MNETRLCSLEQLKAFLDGTAGVQFRPSEGGDARYAHIKVVLGRLAQAGRQGRVLRYLGRTTGYSRLRPPLTPSRP